MKSIYNEENILKRFLKNKISLNVETMIKFLITGTVAFSLTGCGGGGGGSSNTTPPINPGVEQVEVNKNNETHEVKSSNSVITGTINGSRDNFTGLRAINSTVESKATISVGGNRVIGVHGTTNTSLLTSRVNHVVTNSGNISVSGHESTGMLVENGVAGINNGSIKATSSVIDGKYIEEDKYNPNFKYVYENRYGFVVGAVSKNGSSFINNKEIKIENFGVGIISKDNSIAINNGEIIGKSGKLNVTLEEYNEEGELIYLSETSTLEGVGGMFGVNNSTVTNDINGKIWISGEGSGLIAINNSVAINNGEMYISLYKEGSGIYAESMSKAINNKLIYVESVSSSSDKWISGIDSQYGSSVENNGTIQIKIDNKKGYAGAYGISMSNEYSEGIKKERVTGINNGLISIQGTHAEEDSYMHVLGVDIDDDDYLEKFENSSTGKIEVVSTGDATGISVSNRYENSYVLNRGTMNIFGTQRVNGITGQGVSLIENTGIVRVEGENTITGIYAMGYPQFDSTENSIGNVNVKNSGEILVSKEGQSQISSDNIGIYLHGKEMNLNNTSTGKIIVTGDDAIGVKANSYGYPINQGKSILINDGLIVVRGKSGVDYNNSHIPTGIQAFTYNENNKGLVTNNGKIEVESLDDSRGIDSYGNDVINNGVISIKGGGEGIRVQGHGAIATNNGTINADGLGAWGMYAGGEGITINSKEGVINVSATAEGGMIASGGAAINHGTINIEAGNSNTNITEVDKNGNEVIKSAMYATNGGTIENYGTINSNGNLTLGSSSGGVYMIGTSEDGSYGKITAKNVSIDGDVVVGSEVTKNGFKNKYTMENVIDAEDITVEDNFSFTSNSLLYDAEAVTDRWGNLDATLNRNDKTLSDFTTGYITSTADIFGKYQNEESFKTLSSDAKEVIKMIDTSGAEAIDRSLNNLTPTIYSNLGRQMLETSETFKEQDMVAINSLGENSYNFTFIGKYQDTDSRDNIEGYKSKLSGFVGAMSFGDGTFGTIGYGYNDIDYKDNGKGHIQTIHLGINRFMKYQGVDFRLGLGGEYNFHENKRDIDIVGRRAESDFDSYGVRASGEISKMFGENAFVKPYLGLDLAHMKYDSFTESNANSLNARMESENYTSVLPKIGLLVGDRFGGLNLFAGVEYSYELGNMNKEQEFSFEGFSGKGKLPKDDLECGTTGVKAGASYEVNNFTLEASVGKNFGRRDNSFVNASIGYRF
ncbi:MAG: autotransporter domain-containing protein [Cetobacterium somerae]|uniref:autotransporter domain-containing protein n=1 Tax=Cetobacterium somerae TaxID=188913 RepID=UPI003F3A704F